VKLTAVAMAALFVCGMAIALCPLIARHAVQVFSLRVLLVLWEPCSLGMLLGMRGSLALVAAASA
jgi:hypothetical protein